MQNERPSRRRKTTSKDDEIDSTKKKKKKKSVTKSKLKSDRESVRSEMKLLTIVVCLVACAFPSFFPEMHHLVGYVSIQANHSFYNACTKKGVQASPSAPLIPEFFASLITLLLFACSHFMIHCHTAVAKNLQGQKVLLETALAQDKNLLIDGQNPEQKHHIALDVQGSDSDGKTGRKPRRGKDGLFGDRGLLSAYGTLGMGDAKSGTDAEKLIHLRKVHTYRTTHMTRIGIFITIAMGFAIVALITSFVVNTNLDTVINDPFVKSCMAGGLGLPAFPSHDLTRTYSMSAMLIYVILLVLSGVVLWQIIAHRTKLSNCEKDEGKKERADERYKEHLLSFQMEKSLGLESGAESGSEIGEKKAPLGSETGRLKESRRRTSKDSIKSLKESIRNLREEDLSTKTLLGGGKKPSGVLSSSSMNSNTVTPNTSLRNTTSFTPGIMKRSTPSSVQQFTSCVNNSSRASPRLTPTNSRPGIIQTPSLNAVGGLNLLPPVGTVFSSRSLGGNTSITSRSVSSSSGSSGRPTSRSTRSTSWKSSRKSTAVSRASSRGKEKKSRTSSIASGMNSNSNSKEGRRGQTRSPAKTRSPIKTGAETKASNSVDLRNNQRMGSRW